MLLRFVRGARFACFALCVCGFVRSDYERSKSLFFKGAGFILPMARHRKQTHYEASLLSIKPSVVLLRARCGEIVLPAQIVAGFGLNL